MSAWLVADLDTGEVLAAQDPHGRLRPASTLKMLTALTLLPRLDPAASYTAQWEPTQRRGQPGRPGARTRPTPFRNLFEGCSCVVRQRRCQRPGQRGRRRAHRRRDERDGRELRALDTVAANPSGLDDAGQFTSAYDLALIARAGLAREDFRSYVHVKSQFPGKMPGAATAARASRSTPRTGCCSTTAAPSASRPAGHQGPRHVRRRGDPRRAHAGRRRSALEDDAWRDAAALLTWGFAQARRQRPSAPWTDGERPSRHPRPRPRGSGRGSAARAGSQRRRLHSGRGNPSRGQYVAVGTIVLLGAAAATVGVRSRRRRQRRLSRLRTAALRAGTTLGAPSQGARDAASAIASDRDARARQARGDASRAHRLLTGRPAPAR